MHLLVHMFLSILKSSFTASVLIVIVLGIFALFKKRISVRVKNTIWMLVLFKLLLPVTDNVYTNFFEIVYERYESIMHPGEKEENNQTNITTTLNYNTLVIDNKKGPLLSLVKTASVIWINGVILICLWLVISHLCFIRKAKSSKCNIEINDLFKKCNIKKDIPVYQCESIKSPCIFGILKPKIYIPARMLEICDNSQLSHVLLHELVHYKRKDLVYNFFSIIALFLHWFNPLVWIAVKKMNLYREFACDACVLEYLEEEENITYGMTLLNLSKLYLDKRNDLRLSVYFETNNQISSRIWLIKEFQKGSYQLKARAIVGCFITALVILTNHIPVHALNTKSLLVNDKITGWFNVNEKWYYYKNGVMLKDTIVEGHNLGDDGAVLTLDSPLMGEDIVITNGWYISPEDDKWYFLIDNVYATGWLELKGKWFYFDEQGAMVNNTTLNIGGVEYTFSKSGNCTNKE